MYVINKKKSSLPEQKVKSATIVELVSGVVGLIIIDTWDLV